MIINIKTYKTKLLYEKAILNHLLFIDDLLENVETVEINTEKEHVLQLLEENNLKTTPKEFIESIKQSKHKEMLSEYSIDELSKMELYKVPGYNIGYALKHTSDGVDIVSVHNNEPKIKGIGEDLIKSAIKNGGNMLDHFDVEPLNTIYSNMGFVEVNRYKYDPQYDIDGKFASKYDELDVIYRKLK